jgi:16S rRNA (uracil1498-N3)-methyltransferase
VVAADRQNLLLKVRLLGPFEAIDQKGPVLVLPLIRPGRFDWAVEKAAELGASELWPLLTNRTRITDPAIGDPKKARWLRLAEEARKQCARPLPLVIKDILSWSIFINILKTYDGLKLCLHPQGQPWPDLTDLVQPPLLLIGPEGGFTDQEHSQLKSLGVGQLSLGTHVLRTETAALAALAQWHTKKPKAIAANI